MVFFVLERKEHHIDSIVLKHTIDFIHIMLGISNYIAQCTIVCTVHVHVVHTLPHVERPAFLKSILEGAVSKVSDTLQGTTK